MDPPLGTHYSSLLGISIQLHKRVHTCALSCSSLVSYCVALNVHFAVEFTKCHVGDEGCLGLHVCGSGTTGVGAWATHFVTLKRP